ncbi:hypothetical protein H2198_004868 [Neophaeococcomyces mojaviensis]|uniref:Uncharacterized protein n=1 Tax=Neophaeococcomyces mojaviensis TaxID=3383035 RepID=A0ACC3A7H5_9EURO|nr:hypothetical protein H2198_004868 [Knufia sp. JES_112]
MGLTVFQVGLGLAFLIGIIKVYLPTLLQNTYQPLPPGPKRKPLIGNLSDLPPSGVQEWVHWSKHKKLYGPISSVTVLGQTLVILNDSEVAIELLEKRSAIHSSRPRMVFAFEMCGWLNFLSSLPYGQRFRAYRKHIQSLLGTSHLLHRFGHIQEAEVGRFLFRLLKKPDDFISHLRTEAGAIILKIAYGYTIEPHSTDPLISLADSALEQFSQATVPGRWLVDILPFLRFVPSWLPGAGFKRTAKEWEATASRTVEIPFRFVKDQVERGTAPNSFLGEFLQTEKLSTKQEFEIKWTAVSLYTGGADTTVSSLSCFCLAMILFPAVQKKAQEEIDRCIGDQRLPSFNDRANLPYVNAIVKESLRWHPIAPMGIPHVTTQDDCYNGYLIPKGAMLLPNIWGFTHDMETYKDPMSFRPERFLDTEDHVAEQDPSKYVFGFGRRICPGRVLADQSLYLTIAQTLATFKLSEPEGESKAAANFAAGIISHPKPFNAKIEVRDSQRERLIRDIEHKYPWEQGNAHSLVELSGNTGMWKSSIDKN